MTALSETTMLLEKPCSENNRLLKKNAWTGIGKLTLWLAAIWGFVFVFTPWLQNHSATVRTLSDYINSSGIDAGAIYYTEVAEVSESDLMIRDTFRFYLPQQEGN